MELYSDTRTLLGNNIRKKRLEAGWSQAQLAKLLGVNSVNTICNWEAATTAPDCDKLCTLASLFGVSTDYLLGHTNSDDVPDNSGRSSSPSDFDEKYVMYESCDEIGQAAIDNCIKFHFDRCSSMANISTEGAGKISRRKIFIIEDDEEYDEMCEKMKYLKALRKSSQKTYMSITQYLWDCGYGGEICLAFILNVFGIGVIKRVPGRELYNDIEAFLKGNYIILSNVKKTI